MVELADLVAAQDDPWELRGDALAYARRLAAETAPFRIRSAAIQAKAKLSQDKPHTIQDRVTAALQAGPPYVRYRSFGETRTDLEVGIPVAAGAVGQGRVAAGT